MFLHGTTLLISNVQLLNCAPSADFAAIIFVTKTFYMQTIEKAKQYNFKNRKYICQMLRFNKVIGK